MIWAGTAFTYMAKAARRIAEVPSEPGFALVVCVRSFSSVPKICHDGWDDLAERPIVRFSPEGIREDIATDLELL